MPIRVLNAGQLELLRAALNALGLLMLPSIELTSKLEALADETPPAWVCRLARDVTVNTNLPEEHKGLALAITIALTLDHPWTGTAAFMNVSNATSELLPYTDQRLGIRRIVDHSIVYGARKGWAASKEVLYMLLLGDIRRIFQGLSAKGLPPVRPDRQLPRGPIEASMGFLHDLIPRFSECWGLDTRKDGARVVTEIAPVLAAEIRHRMARPFRTIRLSAGELLVFERMIEQLTISPDFSCLQPGSKRNFHLTLGTVVLENMRGFRKEVKAKQRIIARCLDAGAQIQLATFDGNGMAGPKCHLDVLDKAVLTAQAACEIEDWACTCATGACSRRHRLDGWDLATMPTAQTLRSFLWTAVKGPGEGFKLKSFVTGMLYPILCDGIE
jgi:hypothetical protein